MSLFQHDFQESFRLRQLGTGGLANHQPHERLEKFEEAARRNF